MGVNEQLAIYKAWRGSIWDHQTQIHLVAMRDTFRIRSKSTKPEKYFCQL